MRWFRRRGSDLQRLFASLTVTPQDYNKDDRRRDFRQVFGGAAGRRVLRQIIDHCEGLPITEHDLGRPGYLEYRVGLREPGLWIIKVMNQEVQERPVMTTRESRREQ